MTSAADAFGLHVDVQLAVERFLADQPRYPCCLLVHHDIAFLDDTKDRLAARYKWSTLSLGAALSTKLIEIEPRRRTNHVRSSVMAAAQEHAPGPILCTDIDMLFEPSLKLDPLRLFSDTSRVAPLFVMWPGTWAAQTLHYASSEPYHAHYRAWVRPPLCETCIVAL